MTLFGGGLDQESSNQQDMEVLASRLFLEQRIASKVSCRGERMHAFGGIVLDVYCDVCWMGGTVP